MEKVKHFLFNLQMAYLYTFISGAMVSLAASLFSTAVLTREPMIPSFRVYGSAFSFLISCASAFLIASFLENARNHWIRTGSPSSEGTEQQFIEGEIKIKGKRVRRLTLMWISLFSFVLATLAGFSILAFSF